MTTKKVATKCNHSIPPEKPENVAIRNAVKNNEVDVLKDLIQAKANIDVEKEGKALLGASLVHPDLSVARLLLEVKCEPEACLRKALYNQRADLLKALITVNVDINHIYHDTLQNTPLHIAAMYASETAISVLLESRPDLEARDGWGDTPLAKALHNFNSVKLLIDANASINALNDKKETILMIAANRSSIETFELLFEHYNAVDLELRDSDGNTVLCHAASCGSTDILKFLLSVKANIDARNDRGENALWLAARSGVVEKVQTLVDAGMQLAGTCDNDGNTLMCAAAEALRKDNNEAMFQYLISAKASVLETNHRGETPLHRAVDRFDERLGTVQSLLALGAPVNKADKDGNIPLMTALKHARFVAAKELILAKADVNTLNNAQESPLLRASEFNRESIIDALLDAKANLELRVCGGKTVLTHIALTCKGNKVPDAMEHLIAAKASVNVTNTNGDSVLSELAAAGKLHLVERLLAAGARPDARNYAGETALGKAAFHSQTDVMKALLAAKASPNTVNRGGQTALCHAAALARMPEVQILLNAGAKPDLPNVMPSALWIAASRGHPGIVEQLLAAKASVNVVGNQNDSPLLVASRKGAADVVRVLIEARAHLEKKSSDQQTALFVAALRDHVDVMSLLLAAKANPNVTAGDKMTPLELTIRHDSVAAAQLLLDAGVSVHTRTKNGTVVHSAASSKSAGVLKLLLSTNASATDVNKQLLTPLQLAEKTGDVATINVLRAALGLAPVARIVEKTPTERLFEALSTNAKALVIRDLLASKAEIEHRDAAGNTPLLVATRHNHLLGAALLLAKKADVEACNTRGLSPLMLATMNAGGKHGPLIDKLLSAKADVNKRNPQGKTPLMMAVYHGNASIVEKLLSAKADVQLSDAQGNTALSLASRNGVSHIVESLLAAKASIAESG